MLTPAGAWDLSEAMQIERTTQHLRTLDHNNPNKTKIRIDGRQIRRHDCHRKHSNKRTCLQMVNGPKTQANVEFDP
jgi:hypothetical protein